MGHFYIHSLIEEMLFINSDHRMKASRTCSAVFHTLCGLLCFSSTSLQGLIGLVGGFFEQSLPNFISLVPFFHVGPTLAWKDHLQHAYEASRSLEAKFNTDSSKSRGVCVGFQECNTSWNSHSLGRSHDCKFFIPVCYAGSQHTVQQWLHSKLMLKTNVCAIRK